MWTLTWSDCGLRGHRLYVETSDNVDEALDALLEEAKPHVVDFLSDRQVPGRKPQDAASASSEKICKSCSPQ